MGKRGRESKVAEKKAKRTGAADAADDDDDYVAYASDGSDPPRMGQSASSDDESSEEGIALGPGAELGNSDEDAVSDVDVSFEFFDPNADDVRSVARLLTEYAAECSLNAHDVARVIVQQTSVGTCVKITDEPEPVAFISCLNIQKHQAILKGLLDKIVQVGGSGEKGSVSDMVRRGFEEGGTPANRMGLILTERVVNLPPVLVAKMQEAVFSEIDWATEDEENREVRDSFRICWFLYVTEVYCPPQSKAASSGKRKKKEGRKDDDIAFPRPEDEAWMEAAEDLVTWPIDNEKPGARGLTRMRMAMVVPASAVASLRSKTVEIVGLQGDKQDSGDHGDSTPGKQGS
jgi:protein BCP1